MPLLRSLNDFSRAMAIDLAVPNGPCGGRRLFAGARFSAKGGEADLLDGFGHQHHEGLAEAALQFELSSLQGIREIAGECRIVGPGPDQIEVESSFKALQQDFHSERICGKIETGSFHLRGDGVTLALQAEAD